MEDHTRFKDLSAKMEIVMAILDQKEEKDRAKEERLSLMEQSLPSVAKCMESLQAQYSLVSSSQPAQHSLESSS